MHLIISTTLLLTLLKPMEKVRMCLIAHKQT